jgi:hypothetical protein
VGNDCARFTQSTCPEIATSDSVWCIDFAEFADYTDFTNGIGCLYVYGPCGITRNKNDP